MIIIPLGPPGSGKGTQSKKLMAECGWPQLSTGDIFRVAISNKTTLGLKAKEFMDKGELVPDDVVIGVIKDRITQSDCDEGSILDGFPRTLIQAKALDKMLSELNRSIDKVVLFEINQDELVSRLSGRRVCKDCGAMFHLVAAPPKKSGTCDHCGGNLIQRKDDQADVILNRLKVYENQTAPVAAYYGEKSKLQKVDASQSPDDVYKTFKELIGFHK